MQKVVNTKILKNNTFHQFRHSTTFGVAFHHPSGLTEALEINNAESPEEAEVSRDTTFPKRVDSLWKVGANVSGDGGIENAVC